MTISYSTAKKMISDYTFVAICHYGNNAHNLRKDLNWQIVHLSHDIYTYKSKKGHDIRQKIRKNLWSFLERRYPIINRCKHD